MSRSPAAADPALGPPPAPEERDPTRKALVPEDALGTSARVRARLRVRPRVAAPLLAELREVPAGMGSVTNLLNMSIGGLPPKWIDLLSILIQFIDVPSNFDQHSWSFGGTLRWTVHPAACFSRAGLHRRFLGRVEAVLLHGEGARVELPVLVPRNGYYILF